MANVLCNTLYTILQASVMTRIYTDPCIITVIDYNLRNTSSNATICVDSLLVLWSRLTPSPKSVHFLFVTSDLLTSA